MTLARLAIGEMGFVEDLALAEPVLRRRLLDLGLTPGARVTPEMGNAGSSARAYRVRGALIALRFEQADQIRLRKRELP